MADVHPSATVYPGTVLGEGVRVLENAVVGKQPSLGASSTAKTAGTPSGNPDLVDPAGSAYRMRRCNMSKTICNATILALAALLTPLAPASAADEAPPVPNINKRGDEVKHVEVKGTTTDGSEVILTPNEVRHAQENPCTALEAVNLGQVR